ncbi:unnamed protein product, partial [Pylaiella littoralis]
GPQLRLEATPSFSVLCVDMASHAKCSGRCKNDRPLRNGTCRSVAGAAATPTGGATAVAAAEAGSDGETRVVCIDVVCMYTRELVVEGLARRRGAWRVTTDSAEATLHWGDYEMIDWERVVSGELRTSSYCVRKGLSRKAQLSRYCNKYVSKRPGTPLKAALPRTLVIDTWEAFDDKMTFNLGGDIAAFGSDLGVRQSVSLATRLDWCLGDAKDWIE